MFDIPGFIKVDEVSKRSKLLHEFEEELQQKDINGILGLPDTRMQHSMH